VKVRNLIIKVILIVIAVLTIIALFTRRFLREYPEFKKDKHYLEESIR